MPKLHGMDLLERDGQLAELDAALRDAAAGRGGVALVCGEAGAGKSVLVDRFADGLRAPARLLRGLCDDLVTLRPLGPFHDIAESADVDLEAESAAVAASTLLKELRRPPQPVVVVIEDAHWADDASLDTIRLLGRRIDRVPALLVVTYRDDEVPAEHGLRRALGTFRVDRVRRVTLPPLSADAVAELAGRADVDELYALTGGNPFYVREVMAASGGAVPATVQDAVMARVGRLGPAGRDCVELAAVVPTRVERWMLAACGAAVGFDDAERLGVLRGDATTVSFSHELARRAVECTLPTRRRRALNRRVLDALCAAGGDPARLAHHAVEAEDGAAIATHAPVAARLAANAGSRRVAVEHFERALGQAERFTPSELAGLLAAYARQRHLIGGHRDAESALMRAIDLYDAAGETELVSDCLCLLSDVHWYLGSGKAAEDAATRAVAVLEGRVESPALARAYQQRSKLAMMGGPIDTALEFAGRAVELGRGIGDVHVLADSLNNLGSLRWKLAPHDNRLLIESLELAVSESIATAAVRAYHNLAEGHTYHMQYAAAAPYFAAGLTHCEENDLVSGRNMLLANRAGWHFEQGRWEEAEQDLAEPLEGDDVSGVLALRLLGHLRSRRGDADASATLRRAQLAVEHTGELQHLCPIAVARTEAAWLAGETDEAARIIAPMAELFDRPDLGRWVSEAAFWMHRLGLIDDDDLPPRLLEPYASQIRGFWQQAADQWAELGRPYEQADALAGAPEPEPLMRALASLDRLGAGPRAAMVRGRLCELGVRSVPRGPQRATRSNPAGLTARQVDVLRLLANGLTYAEIAERLYVSAKTVDHHMSAVRRKLEVHTGRDAIAAAVRLGMLPPE